jgi:para-nitrobenzyl esterase
LAPARSRASTASTKAFTYFWTHPMPGPDIDKYGAFHTSEVPYVMNALAMSDRPFADADRALANLASSYWATFIATGDPNGRGLPSWSPVSADLVTLAIGATTESIPIVSDSARFTLFEKFFGKAPRQTTLTR